MSLILSRLRQARSRPVHRGTDAHLLGIAFLIGLMAITASHEPAYSQSGAVSPWSDVDEGTIILQGPRLIVPELYRTVAIDLDALAGFLRQAPLERTPAASTAPVLALPMPDGSSGRFAIVESPIMAPELAAKFPEIRTWAGQGLDDPHAVARFDLTPAGFHGMILSPHGDIFIDPHHRGDTTHYISYFKRDYVPTAERAAAFSCVVRDEDGISAEIDEMIAGGGMAVASGTHLRTYRICVAATGEYTIYHGGTVAAGQAAIVTAMNRVNGIYERDIAIRMVLIANNNLVVYTNPNTDPYTNNNGYTMLSQNQYTLDTVIGSANYDIGHVFSTGGGGIAQLGVPCRNGIKAKGVTGLYSPIGDPFYVDYVCHEMGHQWGAHHTFNGVEGGCGGGNRSAGSAYEPGSASTIMGYSGLCGSSNLQGLSDDYFHVKSFDQMVAYSTGYYGNSCAVTTPTGNNPPVVDAGASSFTIPANTAWALTGAATDPDSDPVTYCWEEFDLGPAGHPNTPSGNAPTMRSWDPVTSPKRYFPRLVSILFGGTVVGETYPTYTRNMVYRLVVRDNRIGGGGVDYSSMSMSVTSSAGPFRITYPNTAVSWLGNTYETVTWDVANTDVAPVSSSLVNLKLSVNGGYDYTYDLALNTPNDGSETILVPNVDAFLARVMVESADNYFLDICDTHISISQSTTGIAGDSRGSSPQRFALHSNTPNPFNPSTEIAFDVPGAEHVTLHIYDASGRLVNTLVDRTLTAGSHRITWSGIDAAGQALASGMYLYELRAGDFVQARRMVLLK